MTAEELALEREKWDCERRWRESEERRKDNEELRKDREASWSFWRSPILLSFLGAFVAVIVNIVTDTINAHDKIKSEEDRIQAGLLQEAFKATEPNQAVAKLQLLNDAKLVPRYSDRITDLLQNERYAGMFARATGARGETVVTTPPSVPVTTASRQAREPHAKSDGSTLVELRQTTNLPGTSATARSIRFATTTRSFTARRRSRQAFPTSCGGSV